MPERVRMAAWISLFGFILSGPVGLALVTWLGPQPEWTSAIVCIDDPDPGDDPEAIR